MKISEILDSAYFDVDANPYCHICGNNKFKLLLSSRFRLKNGKVDSRDAHTTAQLLVSLVQIDGLVCARCGNEFIYRKMEKYHEQSNF